MSAKAIVYEVEAARSLEWLKCKAPKKYSKVCQKLMLLQDNQRHPSLQTHKFKSVSGPTGEQMFEAYVEMTAKASAAFRILWYYGCHGSIVVYAVIPHP